MIMCSILQSYIYFHYKNTTHFVDVEKVRKYSEGQRQVMSVSEFVFNLMDLPFRLLICCLGRAMTSSEKFTLSRFTK